MKKIIIAAMLIISISSCKKEKDCYICTLGISQGVQYPPVEYCGPDGGTRQFTDAQGNPIQSSCRPK